MPTVIILKKIINNEKYITKDTSINFLPKIQEYFFVEIVAVCEIKLYDN